MPKNKDSNGDYINEPKPSKTTKKYLGYNDMIFVEYVLDTRESQELKAWANDPEKFWIIMHERTSDGFKFSFTFDEKNNAFLCTMLVTLAHTNAKWHGYCMTQRGSEPFKAFKRVIYVVDVLCDGDLEMLTATKTRKEVDD